VSTLLPYTTLFRSGREVEQFAVRADADADHAVSGPLVTLVRHHVVDPFLAGRLGGVEVGRDAACRARDFAATDRVAARVDGDVAREQPLVAADHVGGGDVVLHPAHSQEALPVDAIGEPAGEIGAEADGLAA